jgi:hypothetical protein
VSLQGESFVDWLVNDKDCAELFQWYGLAVFESAGLEESLVQLIAVSSCSSPGDRGTTVLRSLMDRCRKQTLGSLLKEAKKTLDLPQELADQFDAALLKRNWLVHDFYRYCVTEIVNDQRREDLFQELRRLKDLFAQLDERAIEETHKRLRQRGFSPDGIQSETESYLLAIKEGSLNPAE